MPRGKRQEEINPPEPPPKCWVCGAEPANLSITLVSLIPGELAMVGWEFCSDWCMAAGMAEVAVKRVEPGREPELTPAEQDAVWNFVDLCEGRSAKAKERGRA